MFIVFDTETTGLPKSKKAKMSELDNWPRIIQLAWQVYDSKGNLIAQGCDLIKPDGWVIPEGKFWTDNGFSTEKNEAEGIAIADALDNFIKYYNECRVLIAHHIAFDYKVVGAEMMRAEKKANVRLPQICTQEAGTNICRIPGKWNKYKYPKLEELHRFLFKEEFDGAHDALADVKACARCFFELQKRGVISI